jgi:hypothetical protein
MAVSSKDRIVAKRLDAKLLLEGIYDPFLLIS